MNPAPSHSRLVSSEFDVLAEPVPIAGRRIVELVCGAAHQIRDLLASLNTVEQLAYEADLNERSQHSGRLALLGFVATNP